jgi:hypothetical protein
MNEGVIPSETFTRLPSPVCHRQGCAVGPNHLEKEKIMLKMNLMLGRPRTSVTPAKVVKIEELILDNCQVTICELSQGTRISVGSAENMVHKELKFSKVSARWVPRLLSPEHKERRLVVIAQLTQRYKKGVKFLDCIVTCDETWVHYYTPESKKVSMQWKHQFSSSKRSKNNFFTRKDYG